jgi:hypothetical protein
MRAPLPIVMALAAAMAAVPATASTADRVRVVLKFVKRTGVDGPAVRFDPASCPACTPVDDPLFNADNARETVIALTVPYRRTLELAFVGSPDAIRRIALEGGEIPFRADNGRIFVALPPLSSDAVTAAEMATHVVEPGMVLRFEHADPARRAGAYANGQFPVVERRAADVLEFAQREIVRTLGIGEEVARDGSGIIQIMGFDTNAPHGHIDAPPHIHMHLRWPGDTGTQIGHYYLTAQGLLSHNVVGVKGLAAPARHYGRGEQFVTVAPDGRPVYAHRITRRGWLEIGRVEEPACLIRPLDGAGFAGGAIVGCPGHPERRITVSDDLAAGIVTVATGGIVEKFYYATDSGTLLSPTVPPPSPPSVSPRSGQTGRRP